MANIHPKQEIIYGGKIDFHVFTETKDTGKPVIFLSFLSGFSLCSQKD